MLQSHQITTRTNSTEATELSQQKKAVGKPHPNVHELVEVIKREESITTMKVQRLLAGASLALRRRRLREKERFSHCFKDLNLELIA